MKKFNLALIGVFVMGFGMSAVADEYVLTYSEKELATFGGVADVHARIVKAAKQYCPTYSQIRSHADVKTCVDGVVSDLVLKVNHARMTSFHSGDRGVQVAESAKAGGPDRS